jgi:hypothetical protein
MTAPEQRIPRSDNTETSAWEDRRRWPRIPDPKHSRVWFSTTVRGAQYGHLEEISLGGLSIRVQDASPLQPDRRVVIGLGEWMIPATVRHVSGNPTTSYRIGMEWVRAESVAVSSLVDLYRQGAELAGTIDLEDAEQPRSESMLSAQR